MVHKGDLRNECAIIGRNDWLTFQVAAVSLYWTIKTWNAAGRNTEFALENDEHWRRNEKFVVLECASSFKGALLCRGAMSRRQLRRSRF